jgi:TonB family protein
MFQSFYQLREQPFGVNPDPRFLYLSRTHREALSSLLYRVQMDSGFLAMVAEPGMGKTTLLFHLLHELQPVARTAFIFQTQCTSHELLRHLLSEFNCDTSITDTVRMSQELKSILRREANAGRRCVLLIDEAQNLPAEVLETVRLLSDFETPRRKLLQIILSGQTELGETLAHSRLRQFRQRLSCIVHIDRFAPKETALYIAHRLRTAGYPGGVPEIFDSLALDLIAQLSQGIPRVINNICFNALSVGFALEKRQIGRPIIEEVACDLDLVSTPSSVRANWEESDDVSVDSSATLFSLRDHDKGIEEPTASPTNGTEPRCGPDPDATPESAARQRKTVTTEVSPGYQSNLRGATAVISCIAPAPAGTDIPAKRPDHLRLEATPSPPFVKGGCAEIRWLGSAKQAEIRWLGSAKQAEIHDSGATVGLGRSPNRSVLMRGCVCALVLWVAAVKNVPTYPDVSRRGAVSSMGDSLSMPTAARSSRTAKMTIVAERGSNPRGHRAEVALSPVPEQQDRNSPEVSLQHAHTVERETWQAGENSQPPGDLAVLSANSDEPLPSLPLNSLPIMALATPAYSLDLISAKSDNLANPSGSTSGTAIASYVPARAIWHPAPPYPALALSSNLKGEVVFLLSISNEGGIRKVRVLKGSPILVEAAASAVKRWRYSPALSNGRPVASEAFATFSFHLP